MRTKQDDYRLRIVGPHDTNTYIVRRSGNVSYISSSETPLALSNLIHRDAAATRFLLEDADDGYAARDRLNMVLVQQWNRNMDLCPRVELI